MEPQSQAFFFFFFIKVLSGSFYHGWEGDVKGMEIFGRLPESHFLHMFNSKYVIKDHLFTSPLCLVYLYMFDKPQLTNLPETFITQSKVKWTLSGGSGNFFQPQFPQLENKGDRAWINWYLKFLHYQTFIFHVSRQTAEFVSQQFTYIFLYKQKKN